MRIVFDRTEVRERAHIEKALVGHDLVFLDTPITAETTIPADADVVSVFVSSQITKAHIDALPSLKLISARSTGTDRIDLVAAKERGILVTNVPSYGSHTVAEYAFALIFALSRKPHAAHALLRDSRMQNAEGSEGFDLHGKTIGIVGTGKIGKNAARFGKAFGMEVQLFDAMPDAAFATEIGAKYVSLPELAAAADIISIHVPLLPTTTHLINAEFLALCKPSAIIVNTARGGVVDSVALRDALKAGRIKAAALDVFEGEQDIIATKDSTDAATQASLEMISMPNVIMTPHLAYDTIEAKMEILETSIGNVTAFLAGTPRNTVAA